MTYYIRNRKTGSELILKHIDVPIGKVTLEDIKGEKVVLRLADVIVEYDFLYDIRRNNRPRKS